MDVKCAAWRLARRFYDRERRKWEQDSLGLVYTPTTDLGLLSITITSSVASTGLILDTEDHLAYKGEGIARASRAVYFRRHEPRDLLPESACAVVLNM